MKLSVFQIFLQFMKRYLKFKKKISILYTDAYRIQLILKLNSKQGLYIEIKKTAFSFYSCH